MKRKYLQSHLIYQSFHNADYYKYVLPPED
jgi:hypothetical protein